MNESLEYFADDGVYFAQADYVGLLSRLAICVVDFCILVVLYVAVGMTVLNVTSLSVDQCFMVFALVAWLYLTFLKTSRIRTVGYWLLGARIVDLKGEKPSVLRMTFRLLLCLFGPFAFMFDLLWVSADDHKQTLRDCFAGTCVVRRSAEPAGRGRIRFVFYSDQGLNLMYQQVMGPRGMAVDESAR